MWSTNFLTTKKNVGFVPGQSDIPMARVGVKRQGFIFVFWAVFLHFPSHNTGS